MILPRWAVKSPAVQWLAGQNSAFALMCCMANNRQAVRNCMAFAARELETRARAEKAAQLATVLDEWAAEHGGAEWFLKSNGL